MGSAKVGCKSGAIFGDDDYLSLDKLSVSVKVPKQEKVSFTLCFWIYLLKSSRPGILIKQVCILELRQCVLRQFQGSRCCSTCLKFDQIICRLLKMQRTLFHF